ncbi:MFS transporter [soil metagenome]
MRRPYPAVPMLPPSPAKQALSVWPLFLAIALLMVGNGLQGSLIGLRAGIEGFATATIGTVMSGYYAGFMVGAVAAPKIVGRVGHVRVYAGLASLASTATLAHLLVSNPFAWFGFRMVSGACLAGLYIVAESWLNGASTDTTRGRLLAIYMVVVTAGLALGQLLLGTGDPSGFTLFILASVVISLAVVPMALVQFPAPPVPEMGAVPYRHILRVAPVGLIGALVTGASNGALLAMGAVWGASAGLGTSRIAVLLTLALVGGVLVQWPLGVLSDRFSRRRVIFVTTTVAAVVAVAMTTFEPASVLMAIAIFALGAFSFPMYALSGSHVNDLVGPNLAVGAGAAIMLANGIGAVVGPVGAGLVMAAIGPSGLWVSIAVAHGALGLYASYRLVRQWNVPAPHKGPFVPYPPRSGGLRSLLRGRQ